MISEPPNVLDITQPALVVLCGVSGCGKSSFALDNFLPTQVVSSDTCRALLSDDPANQSVSGRAFELFHWIIEQRLRRGRTTVADSTALAQRARMELLRIAKENKRRAILLVFDVNLSECIRRDALREQPVGRIVIYAQGAKLRQAMHDIQTEEWDEVIFMKGNASKEIIQVRLGPFDLRYERGPFDIIG